MRPKITIESDVQHIHNGSLIPGVFEVPQTCEDCGKVYVALTFKSKLWTTGRCIPCSEIHCAKEDEENLLGAKEVRRHKFLQICPEKYQGFKKHLVPNSRAFEEIITWQYSNRGLLMIGDSERGKTRCAWRLMERLHVLDCIQFQAITELQFSHEVARFGRSEGLQAWIQGLCTTPILFIDDLGKCVMTERVVSELYYLLEERMSHNKPIIATMQLDQEGFASKITSKGGKDMAEAIINRLMSNCQIVKF